MTKTWDEMMFWEEIADTSFGMLKDKDVEQNDVLGRNCGYAIWGEE